MHAKAGPQCRLSGRRMLESSSTRSLKYLSCSAICSGGFCKEFLTSIARRRSLPSCVFRHSAKYSSQGVSSPKVASLMSFASRGVSAISKWSLYASREAAASEGRWNWPESTRTCAASKRRSLAASHVRMERSSGGSGWGGPALTASRIAETKPATSPAEKKWQRPGKLSSKNLFDGCRARTHLLPMASASTVTVQRTSDVEGLTSTP
mmetsp:Transcript_68370/g.154808  ORF Transcript_68370/g.154808 Transcript_68370/m.154808 type:complete len:208 (-) Transcript_68370:1498-2121(-)